MSPGVWIITALGVAVATARVIFVVVTTIKAKQPMQEEDLQRARQYGGW